MGPPHLSTPKKVGIIKAIETVKVLKLTFPDGRPVTNNDVFRSQGVKKSTGWKVLAREPRDGGRTFHSAFPETRGRLKKLTKEYFQKLEKFIEENGFNRRTVL